MGMPRRCPLCPNVWYVGRDHLDVHRRVLQIRDTKGWRQLTLDEQEIFLQEEDQRAKANGWFVDYRRLRQSRVG